MPLACFAPGPGPAAGMQVTTYALLTTTQSRTLIGCEQIQGQRDGTGGATAMHRLSESRPAELHLCTAPAPRTAEANAEHPLCQPHAQQTGTYARACALGTSLRRQHLTFRGRDTVKFLALLH